MRKLILLLMLMAIMIVPNVVNAAWWDVNAAAKTNVTFENNAGSSLTDFPMLATANITGDIKSCIDAVWVNQSETEVLRYELESNTCTANNNSVWWVRTPVLSSSIVNETYWLYHNFTTPTDQSNTYGTWDNNYVYVFHLGDNSITQQLNSKGSAPNGTITASASSTSDGKFGRGLNSMGNSTCNPGCEGLKITNGWSATYFNSENLTIEFWFKENKASSPGSSSIFGVSAANVEVGIFTSQGGGANQTRIFIYNSGTIVDTTPAQTYQSNVWNYFVMMNDGHTLKAWINGANIVNASNSATKMNTGTTNIYLGSGDSGGLKSFNGTIDEFRMSNINMTEAYVKANYNLGKAYFNSITPQSTPDTTNSLLIYQYANMSNIDNHSIVWKLNIVVFNNGTTTLTNVVVDGANNFSIANYTIASLTVGASNLSQFAYNLTRENITTGGIDRVINLEPAKLVGNATGSSNALTIVNPVDPPSKLGGGLANCWTKDSVAKTIWIPIGCTFFWAATYFTS